MFIDKNENKIYISDRNVGIHEMNADTTGLYGQQPFLLQNQWLPYYNDEISWGSITGGFTQDKHGIFWMSKKFNGICLLRFKKNDIYPDGGRRTATCTCKCRPIPMAVFPASTASP